MSSLDKRLVLDSLNLEVNLQREAIHFGSMSQNNGRMNLSLSGGFLLSSITSHKLEGAQKARWKHGRYTCNLPVLGDAATHRRIP